MVYAGVTFHFKYPFLYLLTALTAGIVCSSVISLPSGYFYLLLCFTFLSAKYYRKATDTTILLTLFSTGLLISGTPPLPVQSGCLYPIRARCVEVLPHRNYILSLEEHRFYLSHFYTDTTYRPGDSLSFYARIYPLEELSNPEEFSYGRYLKQKKVYNKLIPYTPVRHTGHSDNIRSVFHDFRHYFLQKAARLSRDTNSYQLISALCLGYKNELAGELQNLFITTGTVHLLSVSGLHTGAIYLLFLFILRISGLAGRKKELLLLPALWSYACLTGLSPSVVRAATILSFITLGRAFSRTYTPINSLAASAFFTLLINPCSLFSLSFLMSYSAYGGIILLYPVLYRLPGPLPPLLSRIYACCCLTVSAQFFTLPITAYFFHTINITGILANMLAIPLATLVLYVSAINLMLPLSIGQYFIFLTGWLCHALIYYLKAIAPYSINIQNLYPPAFSLTFIYGGLLSAALYIWQKRRPWLYLTGVSLTALLVGLLLTNRYLSTRQELLIFHYKRESVVLLNHHGYCLTLKNTSSDPNRARSYILSQKLRHFPSSYGALSPGLCWYPPYLSVNGSLYIIADTSRLSRLPCHTLIVTGNLLPRQLFGSTDSLPPLPQNIITDGSVTSRTLLQWTLFCEQHHIPLRSTTGQGCIRLPLK